MSTLKTNAAQIGQSATATNNFTLYQPTTPDGTVRLGVGNAGSVTDIMTFTSQGVSFPSGTTAQRPAGAPNGMIRYNTTLDTLEYYSTTAGAWISVKYKAINASGGTVTTITDGGVQYNVHTFTSSGTFTVNSLGTSTGLVEYLIIGGGGCGAGGCQGGGGGAGGYRTGTFTVAAQGYAVTVGNGSSYDINNSSNGGNSAVFGITSLGGGRGTGESNGCGFGGTYQQCTSGGSGGGGSHGGSQEALNGCAGTSGQGNSGGNGWTSNPYVGGGGGGAGGAGGNATTSVAGAGGSGLSSTINGTATWRAGGGAGSFRNGNAQSGGIGGGGASGGNGGGGTAGTANTGSGGGAANYSNAGGSGGSGIVIIRYALTGAY